MGFATFRTLGADDDPATLASAGVQRMFTVFMVTVRLVSGVVGAVVAVAGTAPPARPGWVVAASLAVLLWSGLFAVRILRAGPSPVLVWIDVLIVVVLLLGHRWLVPADVMSVGAGTGWVDLVAGCGVLVAQFGLRQPAGLAVGLAIAGAYVIGDGRIREASVHLAVATLLAAGIVTALRRAAESADAALLDAAERRQATIVRAAVRTDEREYQRYLHDTVLSTLTVVHTGGVASDSPALRERAAADLAILEDLRGHQINGRDPARPLVRLDLVLMFAAAEPRPGGLPLDVSIDVAPMELPADVATAISHSVAEALTNVARHADTGAARLAARPQGDGASITVTDNGVGFDISAVPSHRRGLRESIEGRMRAVGGSASVRSHPGAGTEIVLRWPR
jgi:signal transduction histidine kinase